MKSNKSSFFKITLLLILLGSMMMLYWLGYHKNFDEKCIPKNADEIVMADVKNIRNYFIFSYLKNPSQWQLGTTAINKKFDFSNFGIETPDYLALFHLENQPLNQWLAVAKIKNETDFEKLILASHFAKIKLNNPFIGYYSKALGLFVVRYSNQILCCTTDLKQRQTAIQVAEDLFLKHQFLDAKKTEKTIGTPNAFTVWIKKNSLLEEDGIVNVNLKDQEIVAEGQLKWKPKFRKTTPFTQNPNALLSLGFNFEMIRDQNSLKRHSVRNNKIIGFDLDSILIHNPTKTELVLNGIVEKKDSAISYDYDDDFNPIKKVVVHTSREPSFCFSIQTQNSKKVFNYLKAQKAIDNHQVFVNFPLAQTKTSFRNNTFVLEANLQKQWTLKPSIPKIAYLQVNFNKLKPQDWRFIIAKNKSLQLLKPFETLAIDLTQENNLGYFRARLQTKEKKRLISIIK
ncbi:hypothetical protein FNW52_13975 [Flavobacterium sp. ZT3R18]|uniref:hypothetical protein n=1 Tax=Flavobacterium sp. ZT3R18 TaxID=2594429 RepID=UPI001179C4E9|nr:hypothetical protein [Flavobacterium sp. ZT3R18]TRX34141.1 hypothetical protein FNW52_13975 [Flavobacterium sp. ZT3R18]